MPRPELVIQASLGNEEKQALLKVQIQTSILWIELHPKSAVPSTQ